MATPAFQIGLNTANNFNNSFRKAKDENAIESILSNAMQTGDPAVLQQSIGQILSQVSPERQAPAIAYLENTYNSILQKQKQDQQSKAALQAGVTPGLPPAVQAAQFKEGAKAKRLESIYGKGGGVSGSVDPSSAPVQTPLGGLKDVTDDQIVLLTGHPDKEVSEPAKAEQKRRSDERKVTQRADEAKAKRHSDVSQETLKKVEEVAVTIPIKRNSLNLMNNAIAGKDLSFWTKDNLAELTGIEGFRSPEGAIFKTAGKEYFLGNISRAGARPNQWIEQQIADMMPKLGRSPEANLSVTRALENELDLDEERIRLTNGLADELESKLGYVPRDLGSRVNKELQVYAERKQKELFNDLRAIKAI